MIFQTSMIRKTERLIISQMEQASDEMAVIDRLYSDFRKIRHDFANYVQSSQFESEDEDFILRLRVLKKQTLALTNQLLPKIEEFIESDQNNVIDRYSWMQESSIPLPKKTDRRCDVLLTIWAEMKGYFRTQLCELGKVKTILKHLQDRLERSLPPDEYEAKEHLDECDSVQCHITAENVLIAAFAYVFKNECEDNGVQFRFQLPIPKAFEGQYADLFYLLGLAKQQAEEYMKMRPDKTETEGEDIRSVLVRIRFAIGMGLWHFTLEYGTPAAEDEDLKDIEESTDTFYNSMKTDKYLRKILKKRDASLHCMQNNGMTCVDIAG